MTSRERNAQIIEKQKLKIKDLNRQIDALHKIRKAESRRYHHLKVKKRLSDYQHKAETQAQITSCHLEQLGIVLRDNKMLKHQILLLNVEIEYLKGRR